MSVPDCWLFPSWQDKIQRYRTCKEEYREQGVHAAFVVLDILYWRRKGAGRRTTISEIKDTGRSEKHWCGELGDVMEES